MSYFSFLTTVICLCWSSILILDYFLKLMQTKHVCFYFFSTLFYLTTSNIYRRCLFLKIGRTNFVIRLSYISNRRCLFFNVYYINTYVVNNDTDNYFHVIFYRKIEVENVLYDGCFYLGDVV